MKGHLIAGVFLDARLVGERSHPARCAKLGSGEKCREMMVTVAGIVVAPAGILTIYPGFNPTRLLGFAVKKTRTFPSKQITFTRPTVLEIRKSVPVTAAVTAPASTVPPP